jgi:hypothetical protein
MTTEKNELIKEALTLYKIPEECVFASRIVDDQETVIIVTRAGKKIIHKKGEDAESELTPSETGEEVPSEKTYWSQQLNQRIKISELTQ